ncbi:MAG: molecular chaperone HtpG [Verrucomicrobia bacterium]|nr:molecular chaperone HtpG [Verrucomicrobiota bacterium]MBS0645127.1 molecular chaperone HtpG [Verrucomicrobiota bacterium]
MTQGQLKIHSENILPIIKQWLYSSKDIFLRELVSNACDALTKFARLCEEADRENFRIDVKVDTENRRITISDNGIGMTGQEVETYIAQIAFSGAEEFLKKYETHQEQDQVIGHFGLGFYSAYMVASLVTIQTFSYQQGAEPVCWSCDGSSIYHLEPGTRQERGTDIILQLAADEDEYLDHKRLSDILHHYCAFLPHPIYLNGTRINDQPPLWLKAPSECTNQEYLAFYRKLFPLDAEPLFWIHLNVDYPFNLKGILYFPHVAQERDFKKDSIKLFCNRVFVADHCQDVLPEYLTVLRGAIDSPDIPLNVSRSTLQLDRTVRQLGQHICKKVADRLCSLYKEECSRFLEIWADLELVIKFGLLQDEKFYDRVKECVIWKQANGEWATLEDLLAGKEEKKLYYASYDMEHHDLLKLYKEKGLPVFLIRTHHPLDLAVLHRIEEKTSACFTRIDANLDEAILDPTREKNLLDAEGKTEGSKIATFFQKQLGLEATQVEAKSLASHSLPALLMQQEQQRRLQEQLAYHKQTRLPFKPTLVLNTNHKLIQAIYSLEAKQPQLAQDLAQQVYDLALLSQREMDPDKLSGFVTRTTELLEKLTCTS